MFKLFLSPILSTILITSLFGCSAKTIHDRTAPKPAVGAPPAEANPTPMEKVSEVQNHSSPVSLGPPDSLKTPDDLKPTNLAQPIVATPAASPAMHQHETTGVSPEQSIKWLKNGNIRFTTGRFRKDGAAKKDWQRLASGQTPHAVVLSCSDSRVPPEVVFDEKLGEIFTVRNAGEVLDSASIASIEYAIEHLGTRLILVMGHTQCGAVKAALGTLEGGDAGSPALNKLVADIHPRFQQFKSLPRSKDYVVEGWAEARGVATDLLARSEIINTQVAKGNVKIVSALYHLDTGNVEW